MENLLGIWKKMYWMGITQLHSVHTCVCVCAQGRIQGGGQVAKVKKTGTKNSRLNIVSSESLCLLVQAVKCK